MKYDKSLCVLLSILSGLLFSIYLYPIEYLYIESSRFSWPEGDNFAYAMGQLLFTNGKWGWPLFSSNLLDRDAIQSLVYTDFVPIAALVIKLINQIFNLNINHLQIWNFLVFPLQSLSFGILLLALGIRRKVIILVAVWYSLLLPIFLFRVGHIPLLGQFVIPLSLALYFYRRKSKCTLDFKYISLWTMLLSITGLINLYLAFSVLIIYTADRIDFFFSNLNYIKSRFYLILNSTIPVIFLILILYISGFFLPYQNGYSYGYHSMNILSPFIPSISNLFAGGSRLYDPTGGQYEGYNYFGAGFIFIFIISLSLIKFEDFKKILSNKYLFLALIFLTLYSITTNPYFGQINLFKIDHPKIFGIFRSSGRLFWPVTYITLASSILIISKRLKLTRAFFILTVGIFLQIIDTRDLVQGFYDAGHNFGKKVHKLDYDLMIPLVNEYKGVYIAPDYHCLTGENNYLIGDISFSFARLGKSVNTFYLARMPIDQNCKINIEEMNYKLSNNILPIAVVVGSYSLYPLSCIDTPYKDAYICTLPSISNKVLPILKKAFSYSD